MQNPGTEKSINAKYSITMLDRNVGLVKMPESWYEGIPMPNVPNFDPTWDEKYFLRKDLLPGIMKYFDDYGVEYFERLEIWHIPQLRERFLKETGRNPNE